MYRKQPTKNPVKF